MTAAVFHTMRALLQNISAQKLLLDDVATGSDNYSDQPRAATEHSRLVAINGIADQKSQQLRAVLRKMALNCAVIVVGAVFGVVFLSLNAAQGVSAAPPIKLYVVLCVEYACSDAGASVNPATAMSSWSKCVRFM